MQNFQPKLSKVGSALSFSGGFSIVSNEKGLDIKNGNNYADLNSGNFSSNGHLFVSNNDACLLKPTKIFLNYNIDDEIGGGLFLANGNSSDEYISIEGLDTSTLTFSTSDYINPIIQITFVCGENYVYEFEYATSFPYIEQQLSADTSFTQKFSIISDSKSLILSSKTNDIFTSADIKTLHGYSIEYNNGWKFNKGITINNSTISNSQITVQANSINLESDNIVTKSTYVPSSSKSLVTKDYIDSIANTEQWVGGIKLDSTSFLLEKEMDINTGITIMCPYLYKVSSQMAVCYITLSNPDFNIITNADSNTVNIVTSIKNVSFSYSGFLKLGFVLENETLKIYNNASLIDTIEGITSTKVDNIQVCSTIDNNNFTCYATSTLSIYKYAFTNEDFLTLKTLGTLVFDESECYANILFNQKYSDTMLPDTINPENYIETETGSIYGNGLFKPNILVE